MWALLRERDQANLPRFSEITDTFYYVVLEAAPRSGYQHQQPVGNFLHQHDAEHWARKAFEVARGLTPRDRDQDGPIEVCKVLRIDDAPPGKRAVVLHLGPKLCAAADLISTEMTVAYGPKKNRRTVSGWVQAWRYTGATIEKFEKPAEGEPPALCYPEVELKIKPRDGSRAVWVRGFKDSNNPRPSEIWT